MAENIDIVRNSLDTPSPIQLRFDATVPFSVNGTISVNQEIEYITEEEAELILKLRRIKKIKETMRL